MFETYFELERRPFNSVPATDHYYPAVTIEAARSSIVRLIERCEGPGIVIGAVGVGKTLLCQLIAESFRHRCRTVTMPNGRLCTRRALLQVILYELGLPYRDLDEGELRLSLIDYITNAEVCPHGVVLLVDEADNLTMALLDELKALTNLSVNSEPSVRLVLFGTARLEEKFSHPRLESLNQRIAGRFYLEPFTHAETADYIVQQFQHAGGDSDVFSQEALSNIHKATGGTPRLINQLTDHALLLAMESGSQQIDANHIEETWADLQQLPMPVQTNPMASSADLPEDIIEFGTLEEATQPLKDVQTDIHFEPDSGPSFDSQYENSKDNPESLNPESLNPESLNPESLDPESLDPESLDPESLDPGVKLYFQNAHDPFGGEFDEEEIVVDRFVSPDALAQRHRRQVESADSQQLAAQLDHTLASEFTFADPSDDAVAPTIRIRSPHNEPTDAESQEKVVEDVSLYVHEFEIPPTDDDDPQCEAVRVDDKTPVEPEENSFVPFLANDGAPVNPNPSTEAVATDANLSTDDKAAIAFDLGETSTEVESPKPSESQSPSQRNHDFRRLFSQLRNRRA